MWAKRKFARAGVSTYLVNFTLADGACSKISVNGNVELKNSHSKGES